MARTDAEIPDLTPSPTTEFKKDWKRQSKRGKDLEKLAEVIKTLCARRSLPDRCRDHPLGGDWKGWRDCHVEGDWILIYRATDTTLVLGRTGTPSDLF